MNAHLVHTNAKGELAVIEVFMKEGASNTFLEKIWKHIPKAAGPEKNISGTTINIEKFLPQNKDYYAYSGSLTTPPCSEGVKWFVLKQPASVSKEQIKKFTDIFPLSVRPVQPLNKREVISSN